MLAESKHQTATTGSNPGWSASEPDNIFSGLQANAIGARFRSLSRLKPQIELETRSIRARSGRFLRVTIPQWSFPMHILETLARLRLENSRRLGWFDVELKSLFRPEQVVTIGSEIAPKRGERGRKMTSIFDWAVANVDNGSPTPPDFAIERTSDGYAWVEGQRIGWVDPNHPLYYRLDQLETATHTPSKARRNWLRDQSRGREGHRCSSEQAGPRLKPCAFHNGGYTSSSLRTSSSASPKRRHISWICVSLMIKGGVKAMRSAIARTIRPWRKARS